MDHKENRKSIEAIAENIANVKMLNKRMDTIEKHFTDLTKFVSKKNKKSAHSVDFEEPVAVMKRPYVCMPFYVVHYHNNLMKAHHYHKSHQILSASLEKLNIIILMFK